MPELFINPPQAPYEILTDPDEVAGVERAVGRALADRGHPSEWARTGVVYEDPYGMILRDAVRMPDGGPGTYIRFVTPVNTPGVVLLPVWRGRILLIRHFRHSTRRWHLEIPRGSGMPGTSPEDNARRELLEEIGAEAAALTPLGVVHPDTGLTATAVHLFHAAVDDYGPPEEHEGIDRIIPATPAEVADLIRTGELTDGFALAAYTRALLHGLVGLPG
ncbi:NUDIX hydrolase [Actinocorallia sp. B10E7]|uniref:NUDIX hydrolase n=1 Tax=Actinocorallia sp. B10E7 TaxID=3153558 RepID=UPI00325CDCDF